MVDGRRLFLWRCDLGESYMSSYVSALSSCGQRSFNDLSTKYLLPSAWVAAGYSSGQCRLLDYRSGSVVMNWRAHDASVTKVSLVWSSRMSIIIVHNNYHGRFWKIYLASWCLCMSIFLFANLMQI